MKTLTLLLALTCSAIAQNGTGSYLRIYKGQYGMEIQSILAPNTNAPNGVNPVMWFQGIPDLSASPTNAGIPGWTNWVGWFYARADANNWVTGTAANYGVQGVEYFGPSFWRLSNDRYDTNFNPQWSTNTYAGGPTNWVDTNNPPDPGGSGFMAEDWSIEVMREWYLSTGDPAALIMPPTKLSQTK
jgi:hypothetical protein